MCSVEINCLTAGGAGDLDINMDGHILALVQSHYNFQGALCGFLPKTVHLALVLSASEKCCSTLCVSAILLCLRTSNRDA